LVVEYGVTAKFVFVAVAPKFRWRITSFHFFAYSVGIV
jgi:hypothetical protein